MYYNDLPKPIKYRLYTQEIFFDNIIKQKQRQTTKDVDYIIYNKWNKRILLIEKFQEDIVLEIKEYVLNHLDKFWLDYYDTIKHYKFVCFFDTDLVTEVYNKYFINKEKDLKKIKKSLQYKTSNIVDIDTILSIDIEDVLDKLHIEYKRINWFMLALYDNWKWTDWWRANTTKSIVKDFSKDRPQWNQFVFVKRYLWLSEAETFEWFKQNFNL